MAATKIASLLVTLACLAVLMPHPSPVKADIAPPQLPPGANLQPGETQAPTRVRMASEKVLIVLEKAPMPVEGMEDLSSSDMRARVEAEFTMHNDGRDAEVFEVGFPLSDGLEDTAELEGFQAWVDGREVNIERKSLPAQAAQGTLPWAAWRTEFPAGKDVTVRVAYDLRPSGYRPFGTFGYLLETGAAWYGSIGEGTLTFRFPYAVDKFNTALNPNAAEAPNPSNFQVSGTDIVWHFENLEPSAADNIRLTVLSPQAWEAIQRGRAEVNRHPASAPAALSLAKALDAALQFKYGLVNIGDSRDLLQTADAAYRRAIELDPQDGQAYKAYAVFLEKQSLFWMKNQPDPALEKLLPVLARAIELDPADAELRELRRNIAEAGIILPSAAPLPTPGTATADVYSSPAGNGTMPLVTPPGEKTNPPSSGAQESLMRNIACPTEAVAVLLPLAVWFFARKRIRRR